MPQPNKQKHKKNFEKRKGDWICVKCQNHNYAFRNVIDVISQKFQINNPYSFKKEQFILLNKYGNKSLSSTTTNENFVTDFHQQQCYNPVQAIQAQILRNAHQKI